MKRYLLFLGEHYYPMGGALDFFEDYDNEIEAVKAARSISGGWANVLDTKTGEVVIEVNK